MRSAPACSASRTCSPRAGEVGGEDGRSQLDVGRSHMFILARFHGVRCDGRAMRRRRVSTNQTNCPCRLDRLRGQAFRIGGTGQHLGQSFGLVCAGHEKQHFAAAVEDRPRHGHAFGVELRDMIGDDPTMRLIQGFGMREQRSSVAIRTHAQENQIEGGRLRSARRRKHERSLLHSRAPPHRGRCAPPPCDGCVRLESANASASPREPCDSWNRGRPAARSVRRPRRFRRGPNRPGNGTARWSTGDRAVSGVEPPDSATVKRLRAAMASRAQRTNSAAAALLSDSRS